MTQEEKHLHNKRKAVSKISYTAVASDEAATRFREWIEKYLEIAYEAGFKTAKEE